MPFGLVSQAILVARAPSPGDVSGHPLVKVLCHYGWNISARKIFWVIMLKRFHQSHLTWGGP